MKQGGRSARIEAQMQRTLAELLTRGVKDPRVGSVTITAVTMAPDMGSARVHFMPFGNRHSVAEVAAGLESASGYLRGAVGRQLGLRHAPKLDFVHDTLIEKAQQLTSLIDKAVSTDRARASHMGTPSTVTDVDDPQPE
jgi:ribosome-binding factor A